MLLLQAKDHLQIVLRRFIDSINIGLPIMECPEAAEAIADGDQVRVCFETGRIEDLTTGKTFQATAFPAFISRIIEHGGLLASLKEEK